MHKQQALKEPCELPLVSLTEPDEKALFDLAVSLKFGKPQTIARSCQMFMQRYLFDLQGETTKTDPLAGGCLSQSLSSWCRIYRRHCTDRRELDQC